VLRYSLKDGASSFIKQAQSVAFDLTNDEGKPSQRPDSLSWDKKKKKFIRGDGSGADNMKMVRTENGTKLPATFRSGRFDEWKVKRKLDVPRVGERESSSVRGRMGGGGKRFKHHKVVEAKAIDKLRDDYERKTRQLKKKQTETQESQQQSASGKKVGVRRGGKTIGRIKSEIKTVEQIRKERRVVERRKAKNARPSRGRAVKSGGRRKVRR
jgi:ATP-dependent RNA helicase DDX54/DBP10